MIILLQKPVPGLFIFFVNFDENLKKFQKNLKFKNSVKIEEIGFFKKNNNHFTRFGSVSDAEQVSMAVSSLFYFKNEIPKNLRFRFFGKNPKNPKKISKIDFAKIQNFCI